MAAGERSWWPVAEKIGGLVVVVGGIIISAALRNQTGWLAVGIVAIVLGALVAIVGFVGPLLSPRRQSSTRRVEPMAEQSDRRKFIGSIGQQGGFTQQNVTINEAATPTLIFREVDRSDNTLTLELTVDPSSPQVPALTIFSEDPAVADVDLRTASGTMTDYMRGRAGDRPFVSISRPSFPVTLTVTTDNPEPRSGLVAYNFEPVNLG